MKTGFILRSTTVEKAVICFVNEQYVLKVPEVNLKEACVFTKKQSKSALKDLNTKEFPLKIEKFRYKN